MYAPRKVYELYKHSASGTFRPRGNLQEAGAVIGFSFGQQFGTEGNLEPGATNRALAAYIVGHQVLHTLPLILQEEVAMAVKELAPELEEQIYEIKSMKRPRTDRYPGQTYNTVEVAREAKALMATHRLGRKAAVVAFEYQEERAAAISEKAGIEVVVPPSIVGIGDFDPDSVQDWTTNVDQWAKREALGVPFLAFTNQL